VAPGVVLAECEECGEGGVGSREKEEMRDEK